MTISAEPSRRPRQHCAWSVPYLLVSLIPRIVRLPVPFERDEGAYAYVASVIDAGGLPYRDAFDHRPPGIYYLYYFAFRLFGWAVFAPRLMALLFVAAACLLAFRFVQRVTESARIAILSMALLGLATASPAYWGFGANSEIFLLPFLIAALLFQADDRPSGANHFKAGLAYGVAFLLKQVVAPIALASFVYAVVKEARRPGGRSIRVAAAFLPGCALPFLAVTVWFAFRGALEPYWTGVFTYNQGYVTALPFKEGLRSLLRSAMSILALDPCTWVAGGMGIVGFFCRPARVRSRWLVAAALAGSLAGTATGGRFFPHYYLLMLPYVVVAAGVGAANLRTPAFPQYGKRMLGAVLAGSILIAARFLPMSGDALLKMTYGSDIFSRSVTVASFVRSKAAEGTKAYLVGSEPQIHFYASLLAPTRFFWLYPLVEPSPRLEEFRRELLSSLEANPPEYVVLVNLVESNGMPPEAALEAIRIVAQHYPAPVNASDPFLRRLFGMLRSYEAVGVSFEGSAELATDGRALSVESLVNPGSMIICRRTSIYHDWRSQKPTPEAGSEHGDP